MIYWMSLEKWSCTRDVASVKLWTKVYELFGKVTLTKYKKDLTITKDSGYSNSYSTRSKLDQAHSSFRLMVTLFPFDPSLLHFVFIETDSGAWDHVLADDYTFFESEEFDKLCGRLKIRIRTCCAGLVEISELSMTWVPDIGYVAPTDHADEPCKSRGRVSQKLRAVHFTYRSVFEFLNHQRPFLEYDLDLAADLNSARCQLWAMPIISILVISHESLTVIGAHVENVMDMAASLDGRRAQNPVFGDLWNSVVVSSWSCFASGWLEIGCDKEMLAQLSCPSKAWFLSPFMTRILSMICLALPLSLGCTTTSHIIFPCRTVLPRCWTICSYALWLI